MKKYRKYSRRPKAQPGQPSDRLRRRLEPEEQGRLFGPLLHQQEGPDLHEDL